MKWLDLQRLILQNYLNKGLSKDYLDRLKYEFKEIEKQGAEEYWITLYESNKKFDTNKNGLVIPFILGITSVDPIKSDIKHNVQYQTEFPDIDIDFIGESRDPLKKYAIEKYGEDKVCSVGTWLTYKPKLALQDATRAYNLPINDVMALTKALPKEFDDMSYDDAKAEFPEFLEFSDKYPDVCKLAYKMIHRTKAQGKHAGGIIISSVPLMDHVPMIISDGQWTSAWSEGRNTQLSKMGFVKFDFLGLKTIEYIWHCSKLIKANRGITIEWDDMDPEDDRAGWEILPDGTKNKITFSDQLALQLAHDVKTDTIFQLNTDLAKSILQKGGVKSFNDILIYTSLGRPGPLPMIDEYIKRRDTGDWKDIDDPRITSLLNDTLGIIVFQEQLAAVWQAIAGFTVPEAEAARKAVAKKWEEKLAPIGKKWVEGATKVIGEESAKSWWDKMVTFGRYSFNKSHACSYTIVVYRCLWLKSHYPAEWWASVLSECKREDLVRDMGVARKENVKFGAININNLSAKFAVHGDVVTPGLNMIKGIGSASEKLINIKINNVSEINDFMVHISHKVVIERLIKLGAFDTIYKNKKVLWYWYLYAYGGGDEAKKVRQAINWALRWEPKDIIAERTRQTNEFKTLYPKRNKIPTKIVNWLPTSPCKNPRELNIEEVISVEEYKACSKISASFKDIEKLVKTDFSMKDILFFEKEYYGFYWHNPIGIFITNDNTIEKAKKSGRLECIIESVIVKKGVRGDFYQLLVSDGTEVARVMVWGDEIASNDEEVFKVGIGVTMFVDWSEKYRGFNLKRRTQVIPLSMTDDANIEPDVLPEVVEVKDIPSRVLDLSPLEE